MIASEDGWFIAKPIDGEPGEIGSRHLFRIMRAIDALWAPADTGTVPRWFGTEDLINLDQPLLDRLKLRCAFKRLSARVAAAFEATPSEVDPPGKWKTVAMIVAAIVLATPIALLARNYVVGLEPEIVFTLIVMAVALARGTNPALIATAIFAAIFNYAIEPPHWQFEMPGADELIYVLINSSLSFALPRLFNRKWSASAHTRRTAWPYP